MTRQVLHFLETYQRETHDSLPPSLIREAKALYQQALPSPADKLSVGEAEAGVAAVSAVTVQLREVLEVIALGARKAWATFDEPRMACGALLLLSSAAVAAARVRRRWCLGREGTAEFPHSLARRAGGALRGGRWQTRMAVVLLVCLCLHCGALFSNSFILAGRGVSHFLFATLLASWGVWVVFGAADWSWVQASGTSAMRSAKLRAEGLDAEGRGCGLLPLYAVGAASVLARAGLSYVARSHDKGVQEAASTGVNACVGLVTLLLSHCLGHGTRSTRSWRSAAADAAGLCALAAVGVFWALQLSGRLESVSAWVRLGLPRAVYLFAVLGVVVPLAHEEEHSVAAQTKKKALRPRTPAPGSPRLQTLAPCKNGQGTDGWQGNRFTVPRLGWEAAALSPAAALILGADSAPVLGAATILLRLLHCVTDEQPAGTVVFEALACMVATMLFYGSGLMCTHTHTHTHTHTLSVHYRYSLHCSVDRF